MSKMHQSDSVLKDKDTSNGEKGKYTVIFNYFPHMIQDRKP